MTLPQHSLTHIGQLVLYPCAWMPAHSVYACQLTRLCSASHLSRADAPHCCVVQKLVASKAPMEATGSNPALTAKIAAANKAAAEADTAAATATLATAAAEAAARQASAALGACSWTIPATVHPQAYNSTAYHQSPSYTNLHGFGIYVSEHQKEPLERELASARARRPPKVFMGGETDTRYRRSGEPTPATPNDRQLRLKSKIESDDRNSYYPVDQESTTALGHSFNTTACAEKKKKRKEKSMPLGVMTGASVPRSSPTCVDHAP